HTHTNTHTDTHRHTHRHKHTHTHTHTHTHRHTHTHTHPHTHTYTLTNTLTSLVFFTNIVIIATKHHSSLSSCLPPQRQHGFGKKDRSVENKPVSCLWVLLT